MKPENQTVKIVFGVIIFLFGLALAYFTADYLVSGSRALYPPNAPLFYPERVANGTAFSLYLLLFGACYTLVGLLVARIYPVSLGFLFAADILLLHALSNEYTGFGAWIKIAVIGGTLFILYLYALLGFQQERKLASPAVNSPGTQ